MKDLESFVLTWDIGNVKENSGLCDLRSSINVMLTIVFLRLGLYCLKLIQMCLWMVDQSLKIPMSVVENLVVQVREFIILQTSSCLRWTTLGRYHSLLATTQLNINVANGTMTVAVDDKEVEFDF